MGPRNVGIIGYGHLGQFIAAELAKLDEYRIGGIWNRTKVDSCNAVQSLQELDTADLSGFDLVIEVAHPALIQSLAPVILAQTNLFIGSPTALADPTTYDIVTKLAKKHNRAVFVPAGAFWGGEDIQKMASLDTLAALTVTMAKHPASFKLQSRLKEKNELVRESDGQVVLYEGPVRALCSLAPNNVNTMAGAAVAAHTLGFDGVSAKLVADAKLTDFHVITIEVRGKNGFECTTVRKNPATLGKVTGTATFHAFIASIKGNQAAFPPHFLNLS